MQQLTSNHPVATLVVAALILGIILWIVLGRSQGRAVTSTTNPSPSSPSATTMAPKVYKSHIGTLLKLLLVTLNICVFSYFVDEVGWWSIFLMLIVIASEILAHYKLAEANDDLSKTKKKPFVAVPENHVGMVLKGGDGLRPLVNVDGYALIGKRDQKNPDWTILPLKSTDPDHPDQDPSVMLQLNEYGRIIAPDAYVNTYHVVQVASFRGTLYSGIWPDISVPGLTIDAARWEGDTLNLTHEAKPVEFLRSQPERRVSLKNLELIDGTGIGINLGIELLLAIHKPGITFFVRKGEFFKIIDAVVEFIFANRTSSLTVDAFTGKTGSKSKPDILKNLYPAKEIIEEINASAFMKSSGFRVYGLVFKGFEPNAAFEAYLVKKREVAQAIAEAERRVTLAEAEAREAEILGNTRAKIAAKFLEAAKGLGVTPDAAMDGFTKTEVSRQYSRPNSPVNVVVDGGFVPMPGGGSRRGVGKPPKR